MGIVELLKLDVTDDIRLSCNGVILYYLDGAGFIVSRIVRGIYKSIVETQSEEKAVEVFMKEANIGSEDEQN